MNKTFFSSQTQTCNLFVTDFDLIDLKFRNSLNRQKSNKNKSKKICTVFLNLNLLSFNTLYLSQLLHLEWNLNQRFLQNSNTVKTEFLSSGHPKKFEISLCKKNYFKFLDNSLNSIFLGMSANIETSLDKTDYFQFSNSDWNYFDFLPDFETGQENQIQVKPNNFFVSLIIFFPQISHKIN